MKNKLAKLAEKNGYKIAFISPKDIPIQPDYRKFCEDNLYGKHPA